MKLSKRLETVASMVTKGNRVADVGCDHGFVPIFLVESGISPSAVAADVRPGPLSRAKEHIKEHGYFIEYIERFLGKNTDKIIRWPFEYSPR